MADLRRDAEIRLKVTGAKEAAAAQEELAAGQRKVADSVKEADAVAGASTAGIESLGDATRSAADNMEALNATVGAFYAILRRVNPDLGDAASIFGRAAIAIGNVGMAQLSVNTLVSKGTELVKAHSAMLMTLGAGGAVVAAIMFLISVIGQMVAAWEKVQEATRKARMELIAYQEQQELTAQSIESIADRMRMEGMGVEETRAAKDDFAALRQQVAEQISDETIMQAIVAVGAVGDVSSRRAKMEAVSYALYAGGQLPSGAQYQPGRESAVQELLTVFGDRVQRMQERDAAQRYEQQRAAAGGPTAEQEVGRARALRRAFPDIDENQLGDMLEALKMLGEYPEVAPVLRQMAMGGGELPSGPGTWFADLEGARSKAARGAEETNQIVREALLGGAAWELMGATQGMDAGTWTRLLDILTQLEARLRDEPPRTTNVYNNPRIEQGPRLEKVRTGGRHVQEAEIQ